MQRTKTTITAKGKGNTAIGTLNHYACPHCGKPPNWVRFLALAGLLLALAPWLAAAPPGALNGLPHAWATVSVVAAGVSVLAACFGDCRGPWQSRSMDGSV